MSSKYPSSTTLAVAPEAEPQAGGPGVSCWDFAYPMGRCSRASINNNYGCSESSKSKHLERLYVQRVDSAYDNFHTEQPQHKSKKSSKHAAEQTETRTYLLSSPTAISITYPQTKSTISTLLSQPNTKVIYLVPQSNIVCPVVCALMRLPRASGSSFQILPVPTEIDMRCGGEGRCPFADQTGVEEMVQKVLKNTKTRSFDGFLSFEEEREAWTFLERIGHRVKVAPAKG